MSAEFQVVGIGNAIVDVLSHAEDSFIAENGLNKGAMTLIDAARAEALYGRMGAAVEVSGGSAANTIAGIAGLGGQCAYIGKVSTDQLGEVFGHDIRALGVHFGTTPLPGQPPTARSFIVVTPDAERTMNTYLGACVELGPEDIDDKVITAADVTYMEGYLYDRPTAKEAFIKAADLAHQAGRKVSLTLSDSFCVERHRDDFLNLVSGHIDVLFANADEICALYQVRTLNEALDAVRGECDLIAVTRSEHGSVILDGVNTFEVPAEPIAKLVDTTGAGDLYASGFLYGLTNGRHPAECGRFGSICASAIIQQFGARPVMPLQSAFSEAGVELT